jgi:hypothetical protein
VKIYDAHGMPSRSGTGLFRLKKWLDEGQKANSGPDAS